MAVKKQQEKQVNKKKASAAKETNKTTKRTKKDFPNKARTELTEQELKFIDEYLETGNTVQSVRKAGYKASSDASASATGTRLLKRALVRQEIDSRREKMTSARIATAQEVMEYFTSVMKGEIKDQFGLDAPLAERTRAAQELAKRTVDIDNRNKGQADAKIDINLNWKRD